MKYCYNCNRVTIGEPLFCNFCGRSYDVKLCPKLHVNPRHAQVCSACGNRDLTRPQPKVPFWAKLLLVVLTLIPGAIVSIISIVLVVVFIDRFLGKQDMVLGLAMTEFILGTLWWGWTEIPLWFRKTIHKWLKRHEEQDG